MNETSKRRKKKPSGFILGRAAMEKISEVEGIVLSDEIRRDFETFGRAGLSDAEVRKRLIEKYGKG